LESIEQQDAIVSGRCRSGSKTAFEALVRKYMKDAYFIALGLVGNREDALDLSQEAFVRAYRNLYRFNCEQNFFPWFYQILRNLCFSHLRRKKLEHEHFAGDGEEQQVTAEAPHQFTPELVAERNELKDRVWQGIGQLEPKHREVVILRHFQNLSYEQMAEVLFCNKGTVTSRLYYARQRLKEILENKKGGRQA